jgi:hypothetical protein
MKEAIMDELDSVLVDEEIYICVEISAIRQ